MPASAATIMDRSETEVIEVTRHRMTGGVATSFALHVFILLLLAVGLLRPSTPTPPADLSIAVDLVRLGPVTAGLAVKRLANLPQEPTPRTAPQAQQPLHPVPLAPVPPISLTPAPPASLAPVPPAAPPAVHQALAEAMTHPHEKPPATQLAARPKATIPLASSRQAVPADPLASRLRKFAAMKLPTMPMQPGTGDPTSDGLSDATATSAGAATGLHATYSARDFLRAQVIRHWNLKTEPSQSAGWTVSIHLQVRRDGSVALAEIVDPARYRPNRPYFDFALSARNAVLLAAPLAIPPGQYDLVSDIVLPFSARDVLQ